MPLRHPLPTGTLPTGQSISGDSPSAKSKTKSSSPSSTPKPIKVAGGLTGIGSAGEGSPVCHAVFTSDPSGFSPEIFSRATGDVWLGGLNSSAIPLPDFATECDSLISPSAISTLKSVGQNLCGKNVEFIGENLCFRPVSPTGKPILARIHEADLGDGVKVGGGVFVAGAHGPWGISLSLGTGWVMAEMILGRETSVDVKALGKWEAQVP